jgi:hypothetical protein
MTETPSPSVPVPATNEIKRQKLPRWALPAIGGCLVLLVLVLANRPAQNRAAPGADDARLTQLAQRLETIEGLVARLPAGGTAGQAATATGTTPLEQWIESRFAQAETEGNRRIDTRLATSVAELERRFAQLEARLLARVTEEALRAALNAGRPLGPILSIMPTPPAPLLRFATVGAPTPAQLSQGFDEAARAARSAAHARIGVVETAWSHVSAMATLRRAPDTQWSAAAEAEINAARRALTEGDLAGVAQRIARLPAVSQQAMAECLATLRSVAEARSALRAG